MASATVSKDSIDDDSSSDDLSSQEKDLLRLNEEDALFFETTDQENNMDGGNQGQEQDPRHEQGFLGDPLCPIVRLTEEEKYGITVPWKRSLIVKVLGRRMGPTIPANEIIQVMAAEGSYGDELRKVSVWIRVPRLPIEFYDIRVLCRIGNVLGRTIKIDTNTLREKSDSCGEFATERAKFSRILLRLILIKFSFPNSLLREESTIWSIKGFT
ncbi:hypothetical protein SESBI_24542 [Sesbania bispinosa]|nr:hypothetical protein SESBI_24542 [Sesbania bispinosa]